MGVGLKDFDKTLTLVKIQVPFPYMIVTEVVMFGHLPVTPLQMILWTQGPMGAAGWSAMMSFFIWSMYGVATELESPCGSAKIAMDLVRMQKSFNSALAALLHYAWAMPARKDDAA